MALFYFECLFIALGSSTPEILMYRSNVIKAYFGLKV